MENLKYKSWQKFFFTIVFLPVFFLCSFSLMSETITLIDDSVVEGRVVEDTQEYIRIMDDAGFINKYLYSEIQEVAGPEEISSPAPVSVSSPSEGGTGSTAAEVDEVMGGLENNLKRTEQMIQDTLRRLYALPSDNASPPRSSRKGSGDQLQKERDNQYKKHDKYY
jgi:hypothetical protein